MAGSARVRTADAALTALAFLLPLSLLIRPSDSLTNFSVVGALALLLGLSHGLVKETVAGRLDLRLLATPAGLRRLALGLTVVLLTGLLAGQLVGVVVWLQAGLVIGLRAGLWAGLSAGLWAGLSAGLVIGVPFVLTADLISAAKPRAIIGEDARRALTLALAVGLAIGLCAGLWRGVAMGVGAGLWAGLAVGLGIGLRMAPGASPSCASWRYVAFLLCARKRVPFRLARFLDWSCDAGLTRFSGSAYQFRHRELQLWLAAHPHPVA